MVTAAVTAPPTQLLGSRRLMSAPDPGFSRGGTRDGGVPAQRTVRTIAVLQLLRRPKTLCVVYMCVITDRAVRRFNRSMLPVGRTSYCSWGAPETRECVCGDRCDWWLGGW